MTRRVIPITPVQSGIGEGDGGMVSLYAASKTIYPRTIDGLFTRWRWGWLTCS